MHCRAQRRVPAAQSSLSRGHIYLARSSLDEVFASLSEPRGSPANSVSWLLEREGEGAEGGREASAAEGEGAARWLREA